MVYKKILSCGLVFCFNVKASYGIFKGFAEGANFGNDFAVSLKCHKQMIQEDGEACETFIAWRQSEEKQVGELSVTFKAGEHFIVLQNVTLEKNEEKREDRTVFWVFFDGIKKHQGKLPEDVKSLHVKTRSYTLKEFLRGQGFQKIDAKEFRGKPSELSGSTQEWPDKPLRRRHPAESSLQLKASSRIETFAKDLKNFYFPVTKKWKNYAGKSLKGLARREREKQKKQFLQKWTPVTIPEDSSPPPISKKLWYEGES